jgi:fumarate hydratase class II
VLIGPADAGSQSPTSSANATFPTTVEISAIKKIKNNLCIANIPFILLLLKSCYLKAKNLSSLALAKEDNSPKLQRRRIFSS